MPEREGAEGFQGETAAVQRFVSSYVVGTGTEPLVGGV